MALFICDRLKEKCRDHPTCKHNVPHEYRKGDCDGTDCTFLDREDCHCIPYQEEPSMKYLRLKPISIQAIWEDKSCMTGLATFIFKLLKMHPTLHLSWNTEIPFIDAIQTAKECEGAIDWAIESGFIEEEKEEVFYKVGDKFKRANGDIYALAPAPEHYQRVLLMRTDFTHVWGLPQKVSNIRKITQDELDSLKAGPYLTKIEET